MKEYRIALAGNPNVGKSTVFNALTGLHQHTGNWPGKTVACSEGICRYHDCIFHLIDLPGTYSLYPHSPEEAAARQYLTQQTPDAVLALIDATGIERSLTLVLQLLEITPHVAVCVNLMDEAERRGIFVDTARLSQLLGVPVLGVTAHRKKTLVGILPMLDRVIRNPRSQTSPIVEYDACIETAISFLTPFTETLSEDRVFTRYLALRLLEGEISSTPAPFREDGEYRKAFTLAAETLNRCGLKEEALKKSISETMLRKSTAFAKTVTTEQSTNSEKRRLRLDRVLTSRCTAYPLMLLLLTLLLFLTLKIANYPSHWLSQFFSVIGEKLTVLLTTLHAPPWLQSAIVDGVYHGLSWVISVMLPPMVIFFPLFTILEDIGYLPRIAFDLDKTFQHCRACGKQSLTMAMGLGCNAVGVTGCRIIDSRREQLLAILTNAFTPCNGRFPLLILLLGFTLNGRQTSLLTALLLLSAILLSAAVTFGVTALLSRTLLRGEASSFTLELPPFRRPNIAQVLSRSLLDKTLSVLGRAAAVAAPAGLLIWCLANLFCHGKSILEHLAVSLDPFGRFLGLDGAILLAFILGFPANETVLPILLMIYTGNGIPAEAAGTESIRSILLANGWQWQTAVCTVLFTLFHWPCSTTLLTIRKETKSVGYTLLGAAIPTFTGILLCILVHSLYTFFT